MISNVCLLIIYNHRYDANIEKLEKISQNYGIDFVLSVSMDESELPEALKSKIIVSL